MTRFPEFSLLTVSRIAVVAYEETRAPETRGALQIFACLFHCDYQDWGVLSPARLKLLNDLQ